MRSMPVLSVVALVLSSGSLAIAHQGEPAAAAQPPTAQPTIEQRGVDLAAFRGSWVAVHVLSKDEAPQAIAGRIRAIEELGKTLAGVRQVYVTDAGTDAFEAIRGLVGEATAVRRDVEFVRDLSDAKQAQANQAKRPSVALFDAEGREVWRREASGTPEAIFKALGEKVGELTRDKETQHANLFKNADGQKTLALRGYDPVAYIDSNKAEKGPGGAGRLESTYRGVVYAFANAANREKFNADPEKYVPAYGGWCATAMAEGEKVEVDPTNFKVTNGRLFLFYKGFLGNAIKDWNKDEAGLTKKADGKWEGLTKK